MGEMSHLRAAHRDLIAKVAALVADFERETGLRVRSASVVRDEVELAKLLGGTGADYLPDGAGRVWIVPHAEV